MAALISLAAHNASQGGLKTDCYPRYSGIACPSCRGELWDTGEAEDGKVPVHCARCGYTFVRVATVGCYDCHLPYSTWPDLLVPDAVWEIINPTVPHREAGGLLCPNCIHKRCEASGLKDVPVAFASGPLRSVEYVEGTRMAFLNDRWHA